MIGDLAKAEDIARAFHCPLRLAFKLYFKDSEAYRNIFKLGPMRVHWRRGHGWHLDNRPIRVGDLEKLHMGVA